MSGHSSDAWLEGVYHAKTQSDLIALYDGWAKTYDADMQGIGYIHPAVIAGLVGRYVPNKTDPVFDAGVGTGTVGNILAIMGYSNLIGVDMSEGMLARAEARKIYTDLRNRVLGEPLDFADGSMAAIVSTGVFTTGHGPANAWDELTRLTGEAAISSSPLEPSCGRRRDLPRNLKSFATRGWWHLSKQHPSTTPCPIRPRNQNLQQGHMYIAGSKEISLPFVGRDYGWGSLNC